MIKAERHTLKLAARTEAVARLRARRAAGQPVSALVRQTAQVLGISERTVWRSLRSEPETREIERLPEDWIDRYLSWGGNVAAVWRELGAEADAGCSLRTMQPGSPSG